MLTVCVLLTGLAGAPKADYPRPELLAEPAQLAREVKAYRVIDVRPRKDYDAGHVPGAVHVEPEVWAKAFAAGQEPAVWARKIGELGIDDRAKVVVYDDAMSKDAARVWWVLRYWGAKDARLLNGGWKSWTKAGLPTSKEAAQPTAVTFSVANPAVDRLATKQGVLDVLEGKKAQIIDARSEAEYCGETALAKRAGAIPGALHLEWKQAIDPATHRFKSADELTAILKKAGIDPTRPAVTYCQSGGRAAVMAFTLELMGARDVANYYRSWSEWGNAADTPVEKRK